MPSAENDNLHPVTRRLKKVGITSVVVIDDAYNSPTFEDLGAEIADFWAEIVRDAAAVDELRDIKPDLVNESGFDESVIRALWDLTLKEDQSPLLIPCKTVLFSRHLERQTYLVELVDNLSRIGITPILLGTNDDLPNDELKLFFLDFFLESNLGPPSSSAIDEAIQRTVEGRPDDPAIQASIGKAKEILRRFNDAFIILMSSKDGVERARDSFREQTGLIEGMFDYAPKERLAIERDLYMKLGISAAGLPARHDIQDFVNALEVSVKEASTEFVKRIKSLSFEDYSYINSLSLRAEGQPLGDYMLWLYKSLLAHLVHNHEGVIETQRKLDSIDVGEYVPLKRAPSLHLADIYRRSLTEPGRLTDVGLLRLGDLYVRGSEDVLMVINASCDLIYSSPGSSRPFPENLSILLHPGRLASIDERSESKVTELFVLEGQPFKIVWNHDGVITKEYGEVENWLESNGYSKKARIIESHALEIQHHFAANLTRIGMPVAPPLPRRATVQVFGKNEDGSLARLGNDIPKGVVIDQEGFRFTFEGFNEILERVADGIGHYAAIRDGVDKGDRRYSRLGRNIERLEDLLQDSAEWFTLIEGSHAMPNENGRHLGSKGIIQVFSTPGLDAAQCIIALNLSCDE